MPIPLRGDRSAWDMNYEDLHASDIENEKFLNHVPTSEISTEGYILYSSGSDGWIASNEIIIPLSILETGTTPANPAEGYVKFYAKTNDKLYCLDSEGNETELATSGSSGGAEYFLDLLDAPSSYSGQGGKILAVKSSVDGIEFIDASTSGSDPTAIHSDVSGEIHAIDVKYAIHDNDEILVEDSQDGYTKKRVPRASLYPTWLTYLLADFENNAGKIVAVNVGETGFELVTPTSGSSGGAEYFTDLGDVPTDYTDQAGKVLAVNSEENALEFVTQTSGSGGGASAFIDLTDVPSAYTSQAGKILAVNSEEDGLEFITPTSGSGGGSTTELVIPISTDFTWLNQGSATVSDDTNAMYMYAPAVSDWNVRSLIISAPSTPYTLDTYLEFGVVTAVNYVKAGIILRDSSSGNCIVFSIGYEGAWSISIVKLQSITSYEGSYDRRDNPMPLSGWLRIEDDGTDRTYSISYDKKHFMEIYSTNNDDWIEPDQVGLFINTENGDYPCGANFMHWKVS